MGSRNDELRREQAYQDFKNLPNVGRKHNPNQLYDWYMQRLKEDPSVRPLIPSTSRGIIYKWMSEDRWNDRLAKDLEEERNAEKAEFGLLRRKALGRLYLITDDAVSALHSVARNGKNDRDRVSAAIAILDRVGVVAQMAQKAMPEEKPTHPNAEPDQALDLPAPNASEEEFEAWLTANSSNRNT